jgi:hypothetical protein
LAFGHGVRDSKNPEPVLRLSEAGYRQFIASAATGKFDQR